MLKALTKTDLFRILSLMAVREAEFERERGNRPLSHDFWDAVNNPKPITNTERQYQNVIESISDPARIELKALLLIGRSPVFQLSEWQDVLSHAAARDVGESDPYKNWLWDRCASMNELALGCCNLLCESKALESDA